MSMMPLTEGDLETFPVNESARSDFGPTIGHPRQNGSLVDGGLFVLAACWPAAFSCVSLAIVVAAFLPCGAALSPESWRHPGYCSQPWMLSRCFWEECGGS